MLNLRVNLSIIFSFIILLIACGKMEIPENAIYEVLSPDAFEEKLANSSDVHLIDARTPPEVAKGHLPNAIAYDYKANEIEKAVKELDNSKPVFIYCGSGIRSKKSAEIMMQAGFKEIYDMEGGMKAWLAAGKKVE